MNIALTKTSEASLQHLSVKDSAPHTAIFLNASLPFLSIKYVACAMIDSAYIALYCKLCCQGEEYAVVIAIGFSSGVIVWMEGKVGSAKQRDVAFS